MEPADRKKGFSFPIQQPERRQRVSCRAVTERTVDFPAIPMMSKWTFNAASMCHRRPIYIGSVAEVNKSVMCNKNVEKEIPDFVRFEMSSESRLSHENVRMRRKWRALFSST